MPRHLLLALACASSLSACATGSKLTGDQQLELIRRLGEYGCGGSIQIGASGATGQLGGGASANFNFTGECPKRTPPTAVFGTPANAPPAPPT